MSRIVLLFIIFILCIILVLWINFEIFPLIQINYKRTYLINDLLLTIALSYITSFIFYFIVVYIKERKDRANSKKFLERKVNEIIGGANHIRQTVEQIDDVKFNSYIPEKNVLRNKLNKINLEDDANQNRLYPFSYEQLFKEHSNEIRETIDRILILLPFLNSNFISLLNEIYDSGFFTVSTKMAPVGMINKKMQEINAPNYSIVYSDSLVEYLSLIEKLKKIYP
ncbi:MAG: hypothetical protein ACNS60_05150 [Candidatus Cyclobacteriaceae bacterium M2_1C_046]